MEMRVLVYVWYEHSDDQGLWCMVTAYSGLMVHGGVLYIHGWQENDFDLQVDTLDSYL
jgi:hypothetical protein